MLTKLSAGAAPVLMLTRTVHALCTLGLVAQLSACTPNGDLVEANRKLELANQKIAALEAQLSRASADAHTAGSTEPADPATPAGASPATPAEQPTAIATVGQQWRYNVSEEQMTGGKRKSARVDSTNAVEFDFPYNGSQNGHLTLRTDPRYGKDVIFSIEKGQILCPSYEGCGVQVRFDDEKPNNFAASAADDNSSNLVFIRDYNRFLARLKKAKRVRLSVNIYQQGRPVFDFDVSGFDFERYQAKS